MLIGHKEFETHEKGSYITTKAASCKTLYNTAGSTLRVQAVAPIERLFNQVALILTVRRNRFSDALPEMLNSFEN